MYNQYSNYDQFTNVSSGDVISDSLFGTNREETKNNNALQLQMMKDQNKFNEYMSNTSFQRGLKDMEAAGINPMINGGANAQASTPTSASANLQATNSNFTNFAQQVVSTYKQFRREFKQDAKFLMSALLGKG